LPDPQFVKVTPAKPLIGRCLCENYSLPPRFVDAVKTIPFGSVLMRRSFHGILPPLSILPDFDLWHRRGLLLFFLRLRRLDIAVLLLQAGPRHRSSIVASHCARHSTTDQFR
jgi:hypothetical protein